MRNKIAIFEDVNTSSFALQHSLSKSFPKARIIKMNGKNLQLDDRFFLFVLPGIVGEQSHYYSSVGEKGNKQIRSFVENGGIFLGLCAGAYYACTKTLYHSFSGAQKVKEPGLDFFNAIAFGSLQQERIAEVSFKTINAEKVQTGICYDNGPAMAPFDTETDHIEVIARYKNIAHEPIAIASKTIKNGRAIFSGVLPEITFDLINNKNNIRHIPALYKLMQDMAPHEQGRKKLWTCLTQHINAPHLF